MSWLHPVILYGLGLAAIPVILHLLLRQKPKKLLFPALRLIQNRRKQNVRRMRIRHLLLLLLRMAVITVFVFAIARPSVPAADYSLNLRESLTLIGVVAAAVAVYYGLSYRWRSAELPAYELRSRQSRLRSGMIGAALFLLLLTVVWPYQRRVVAQLRSPAPAGDVTLPVAAVVLLDTSLSMGYQQAGQTRLDVAREIALTHLSELPTGSRVAVADVGSDHPILFQSTLAAAKMQLESRELRPRRIPLNDRIRAALRLHEDDRRRTLSEQAALPEDQRTDRYLRRIYVLTDLSKSAWRVGAASRLAADLEEHRRVNLFLIDVGQTDPRNTAIIAVEPSRQRVTAGGEVFVRAEVAGTGRSDSEQTIELLLDDGNGRAIKVDQQTTPLAQDSPQEIEFGPLVIDAQPMVHGEVRLVSSDSLPFDDVRYFTVQSRPPLRVLSITPRANDANEWSTALEVNGYEAVLRKPADLAGLSLSEFNVICLINVPSLPDDTWSRLAQFVEQGGGLAVFLGSPEVDYAVNYDRSEPRALLPGVPLNHTSPGVRFLRVSNPQHPVMRELAEDDLIGLLESLDVMRFWRVRPADDAAVIAEYTDDARTPALLERVHGDGRVMMFTTAVDNKDDWWAQWNILPDVSGPVFTYLAVADQFVRHLAQDADVQLTYNAGEQPLLKLEAEEEDRQLLLQHPGFRQSRLTLPAGEALLTLGDVSELGRYNLKQTEPSPRIVSGFSINAPPSESDFTRASVEELDAILGEERYQLARSIDELQEEINLADLGRELFPLILAAAILIFCAEHFMANWFYDDEPGTTPGRVTWETAASEAAPQPAGATT